ncbi:general stress protein [Aneurinibacillus tyrosinisolvens]|uniref:general stress protein n=1 Tax=Aneurinibacillus tyrosinisolvens TaxID=1443435 RepID=UPI00063F1A09|nr:general stress protein [Aneurinibacillus tyrosinisolvens]
MNTNLFVKEYMNATQAYEAVNKLKENGYEKDNMYVFAHDSNVASQLVDKTDANKVGVVEKGVMDTVANLFKSRGDELRNEFENLGFSPIEANQYESKLDDGKVLVVVKNYNKDVGLFL